MNEVIVISISYELIVRVGRASIFFSNIFFITFCFVLVSERERHARHAKKESLTYYVWRLSTAF